MPLVWLDANNIMELKPEITLKELRNKLYRVRVKWYDIIYVELNVATEELDIIKSKSDDPSVCLREMIALRLRSSTKLTWKIISDALRTEVINETVLAKGIESDQSENHASLESHLKGVTESKWVDRGETVS